MKKFIKYFFTMAIIGSMVVFQACKEDEPDAPKPDARFNSTQDATNPLTFTFENVSLNATSYSWDFGDGETSTDESPSHTYAAAKVYTVTLTATGDGGSAQRSADVDTRTPINKLAGDGTAPKVWKLARQGLAIQQESKLDTDTDWGAEWSFGEGGIARFDQRTCMLTDEYSFSTDGTFSYNSGDSYWSSPVLKLSWGCKDITDPEAYKGPGDEDYSAWGSGTHTFQFDADNDKLKVIGMGAFMGFYSRTTDGAISEPQTETEYVVEKLEDIENGVDTLRISVSSTDADSRTRRFTYVFVSYDNASDEPGIPGPPPTTDFDIAINGLEVTFTNTSELADSYLWDFGDGETSTEVSPVHTYAADGAYSAVLTATNVDGSTEKSTNIIFGPLNLDFEGTEISWFAFGGASIVRVPNSVSGGINTSDHLMRMDQPMGVQTWAGIGFNSSGTFDFSTKNTIKIKVYSDEAAGKTVRMRLEGPGAPTKDINIPTTKSGEWEEIIFTYDAVADSDIYNKFVLYFDRDGDKSANTVYFFDDIVQE